MKALILINVQLLIHLLAFTTAELSSKSAGSYSGFFVGATPQNEDEDELYDDADSSDDDFAEFDLEDDEQTSQKVLFISVLVYLPAIH